VLFDPICYQKSKFSFKLNQKIKRFFFLMFLFLSKEVNIIVQTNWMKDNINVILNRFKIKNKLYVTPYEAHLFNNNFFNNNSVQNKKIEEIKPFWFYPAAYYPHKNHQFLIELARLIKKDGNNNIKIVTTINDTLLKNNKFINDISLYNLGNIIINLGWINQDEVNSYLFYSEGLIFPSTFESLGIPLLEAVSYNKKIIAADIPTTKEILHDYAKYFDIHDRNSLRFVYEEMLSNYRPNNLHLKFKNYNIYEAYYKNFIDIIK
jgi:glycosyltransferase involved in cell wall biosynthesis